MYTLNTEITSYHFHSDFCTFNTGKNVRWTNALPPTSTLPRFDADVLDVETALFHLTAAADCGNTAGTIMVLSVALLINPKIVN